MLIRDTKEVYKHQIKSALKEGASADDALAYIFGSYGDDDRQANFVIREWREDDKTKVQRLNMLWAIPLTAILSPFQYVLNGQVGWDTKTKMGRFILRVTGHMKDA